MTRMVEGPQVARSGGGGRKAKAVLAAELWRLGLESFCFVLFCCCFVCLFVLTLNLDCHILAGMPGNSANVSHHIFLIY